jgi:hypothetical protein
VTARGSTTSFQAGARSRIDQSTIWPQEGQTYLSVPIVGDGTRTPGQRPSAAQHDRHPARSEVLRPEPRRGGLLHHARGR